MTLLPAALAYFYYAAVEWFPAQWVFNGPVRPTALSWWAAGVWSVSLGLAVAAWWRRRPPRRIPIDYEAFK